LKAPNTTFPAALRERLFFCPVCFGAAAVLLGLTATAACAQENNAFQSLRAYLNDHSQITQTDTNGGATSHTETHLEKYAGGKVVLIYERWEYADGTDRPATTIQMITYTFRLEDLDPASIRTTTSSAVPDDPSFWMTEIRVLPSTEFVPYKNYTDTYAAGSLTDRSTSKGKSRKIAVGYFDSRETAQKCADLLRDWVAQPTRPAQ
jgi:hypothetical protein